MQVLINKLILTNTLYNKHLTNVTNAYSKAKAEVNLASYLLVIKFIQTEKKKKIDALFQRTFFPLKFYSALKFKQSCVE